MAEGAFLNLLDKKGTASDYFVDSAGTSAFHIGNPADRRMNQTAYGHGIHLPSRARQVNQQDFHDFDYIVAMDRSNQTDLLKIAPRNGQAQVVLMRDYDPNPNSKDVPDPYYGGQAGFEEVYQIVTRSCEKFYDETCAN